MRIKLKHPYIKETWIKHRPQCGGTLVIETNLRMPPPQHGFLDSRFCELLSYLARETKSYWPEIVDIEIRRADGHRYMQASRAIH